MRFQIIRKRTLRGVRWFWRLRAGNGKIIATAGEDFHNRADVTAIVATLQRDIPNARVDLLSN